MSEQLRKENAAVPQEWTTDSIIATMLEEQESNPAWTKTELWGIRRDIVPLLRLRINAALATERERHDRAQERAKKWFDQLAAERKRADDHAEGEQAYCKAFDEATAKLTDEREKVKALVELLHKCKDWMLSQHYAPDWNQQIDNALAKVK